MSYYLYSKPFTKLPNWTELYTAKIISLPNNHLVKIHIGQNLHYITSDNDNLNFTEILTENLPIKLVPDSLEFEPIIDYTNQTENYKISVKKFDENEIDEFLKTPDCLFYLFTNGDWKIIRWEIDKQQLIFKTLQTLDENQFTIFTETSYNF